MPFDDDDIGGSSNPICVSSDSSVTPSNDAASTLSRSRDVDLDRALRELERNDSRNAQAGSSRHKPLRPHSPGVPGKRRIVDETLVSRYDYSEPERKVRQHTRTPSQTTLMSFIKTSPSTKNRVQADAPAGRSRNGDRAFQRTPSFGSLPTSRLAPPAKRNGQSSSRSILGGTSTEDAIELSDVSRRRSRRPTSPPPSRGFASRRHSRADTRQPSVQALPPAARRPPGKMASNSQPVVVISDSDEETPVAGGAHKRTVTASPRKELKDPRILVPETVASPLRGRSLVEETVLPRPPISAVVASQSYIVPESATSSAPAIVLDDSDESRTRLPRRSSRARSAATPEERQERQRRANERIMTPASIAELPSILDGLAKTPTPKKPVPKKLAPAPDANSAKRRLFAANANLDDESYRPNPGSVLARPVKPDRAAWYQANRPRRSLPVAGKYALPPVDTPIQQWPTRPGTSHTPQARKRKSAERHIKTPGPAERRSPKPPGGHSLATPAAAEPKSKTPAPAGRRSQTTVVTQPRSQTRDMRSPANGHKISIPVQPGPHSRARAAPSKPASPSPVAPKDVSDQSGPSTPQHQRCSSMSSCLTPLPLTQIPPDSPAASLQSHSTLRPERLEVVREEPSANMNQPGGRGSLPVPAEPPAVEAVEEADSGSATDYENAGSEFGLDLYADFAEFAGSPSQSILITPAKRSMTRLSVSPTASKTFRSHVASKFGVTTEAGESTAGPGPPEHSESLYKASQPPMSPTARLLAEEQERERKVAEERERAQTAAAEREANNRAQFEAIKLLEGSDDSDDGDELRLSQVFRDIERTPSPGVRRSVRQRQSVSKVSDDDHDPSLPQRPQFKSNPNHSKLFKELDRDTRRGMTTAHIEAALSASASPERRQLDLANVSGVDEAVLAEAQRIQREGARKEEREAVHSVFWEEDRRLAVEGPPLPLRCAYQDYSVEMLEDVYDESTLARLVSCLPVPASTEVLLNEWLFELAFCARDEELAYVALERLLEFIVSSTNEPTQAPDGLFWLMNSAWYQLGAKVRESERPLARVARDRATASTFICRIASMAANKGWLGSHCAWFMLCHLAVLASDSSTSSALSRQIEAATADLFNLVLKENPHDNMIAEELASLELAPQVRSVLALGQRNSASRAAVRWTTIGLLLANDEDAVKKEGGARPIAHRVLQGLYRIEDEIRSENADYGRISNLLALWCAGLTDLDDGWSNDPEAAWVVRESLRLRDLVRDDPDDPATSEVKGRLQLTHHIVSLHVQAATDRERRARIAGKGLEVGVHGQTRLSFGRGEGKQSDGEGEQNDGEGEQNDGEGEQNDGEGEQNDGEDRNI
ncbi:hypothetical protein CcaverHIS002_0205880 [Cutaneotrichosporon cavernicola]|nr:hypothetical protein CcaverHIS002_0205880 [Cutaneotrichosporon cavernicola]BEI96997.1 hypothetical protein CcaverHIS631_0205860 [Cutaneotrichosporon cavernicola]